MVTAAVPGYLGSSFNDCPPGHRFTLYGKFWQREDWMRVKNIKPKDHLEPVFNNLPSMFNDMRNGLILRQQHLAETLGANIKTVYAKSISPFLTGTGIEHPLENGMSFLNPYGLPYLPGSGVKGVLRQSAEDNGWTKGTIDLLFGPSPENDNTQRGALIFWDVFPQCSKLSVDIMNPHYGEYYKGNAWPHDAENPIPIYFLTIPPETTFIFNVQCNQHVLGDNIDLKKKWANLLDHAFLHAFDWIGFGAKTSVGYGQIRVDKEIERSKQEERKKRIEDDKNRLDREEAVQGLPQDAAWIKKQQLDKNWQDNNRLLDDLEKFLSDKEKLSSKAYQFLASEISSRWEKILDNPDAVKGKRKKPKYSQRPRDLAKKLISLKPAENPS